MLDGKSIFASSMNAIRRFKPQENRLINALLRPDFPQRDLLIAKIESTKVKLDYEPYGLSFWFSDKNGLSLGDTTGELIFMTAYQGDNNPLYANVVLYKGRLREIYFYTADGSDLVLDDIVLNNVEYYVRPWFIEASNYVINKFELDSWNTNRSRLRAISINLMHDYQDRIEKAKKLLSRCSILASLDYGLSELPFSIKIEFYLGKDCAGEYKAIIMQSVLKDYFTIFVTDGSSIDCKIPRLIDKYPDGELLEGIREYLYDCDIKELSASELEKDAMYWRRNSDIESGVTLFECLFMGFPDD